MNKVKRIAAMAGIILIVSMYVISLISAFVATEYANGLFLASIFTTFVVPVFLWFFMVFYKHTHKNDQQDSSATTESVSDTDKNTGSD